MFLIEVNPAASQREKELVHAHMRSELARRKYRLMGTASHLMAELPHSFYPSPTNVVTGSTSSDPFDCMPVRLTNFNVWLMRQYFHIGQPGGCGEETCASCSYDSEQTYDALHTYSLLASSTARYREVDQGTLEKSDLPEAYIAKALALLRERVTQRRTKAETRRVMVDVMRLYVCEWYLQNEEAARLHLRYFTTLWSSLDINASTFDLHVHNVVALNDIILAAHMGNLPILQIHPAADDIPLSIRRCYPRHPTADNSCGFKELCQSSTVNAKLKLVMRDLIGFSDLLDLSANPPDDAACSLCSVSIATPAHLGAPSNATNCRRRRTLCYDVIGYSNMSKTIPTNLSLPGQSRRRLRVKLIACLHRLICIGDRLRHVDEALRWSLFICTVLVAALHPCQPGKYDLHVFAVRLQDALLGCQQFGIISTSISQDTGICAEVRFWMFMTGSRAATQATELHNWFLRQAFDCAKQLKLATVEQAENILQKYMFSQYVHERSVQALAQDMGLARRSKRQLNVFDCVAIVGDKYRKQKCVHDF